MSEALAARTLSRIKSRNDSPSDLATVGASSGRLPIGVLTVTVHKVLDLTCSDRVRPWLDAPRVQLTTVEELANSMERNHVVQNADSTIQAASTKVSSEGTNPEYNETFQLKVFSQTTSLALYVINSYSSYANTPKSFMGMTQVNLSNFFKYGDNPPVMRQVLHKLGTDEKHHKSIVTGAVLISAAYKPATGLGFMEVSLEWGKNLPISAKRNSLYCIASLGVCQETSKPVPSEDGNPQWGELLKLGFTEDSVSSAVLQIDVMEKYMPSAGRQGGAPATSGAQKLGSVRLSLDDCYNAQVEANKALADDLMPLASILQMHHKVECAKGNGAELYMVIKLSSKKLDELMNPTLPVANSYGGFSALASDSPISPTPPPAHVAPPLVPRSITIKAAAQSSATKVNPKPPAKGLLKPMVLLLGLVGLAVGAGTRFLTTTYAVKAGDTLSSIARRTKTTVTALQAANPDLTKGLRPGMVLNLK